jgi:carbonic anhydrase/acetyltransferase-like protein (isoleucine patch superfamily)
VLVAGVPARIVRDLTSDERTALLKSAEHYVAYAATFGRPERQSEIRREA